MSGFLVDTNILSEFAKRGEANPGVMSWLAKVDDVKLFTSVLALAEILRGVELLDAGRRRSSLERWFGEELVPFFGDRILPVSLEVAIRWAALSIDLESRGKMQPTIDGLIAATALEHGLTVVTHNVKDFKWSGVPIEDPWAQVH